MGRCHLLQMLAVLGAVASPLHFDQANAAEQTMAQAAPPQAAPAQAAQPEPSKKQDDIPPGGCTPIGLTASGEMVFPLLCRALLEQQRGPISQEVPSAPPKPDAPVTASKQETVPADSAQGTPTPPPQQPSTTAIPTPESPVTTSALPRPELAPQTGVTGVGTVKESRRDRRRKQLAIRHGGAAVPTGAEVTGTVNR
jgi:hypothetical protein